MQVVAGFMMIPQTHLKYIQQNRHCSIGILIFSANIPFQCNKMHFSAPFNSFAIQMVSSTKMLHRDNCVYLIICFEV